MEYEYRVYYRYKSYHEHIIKLWIDVKKGKLAYYETDDKI